MLPPSLKTERAKLADFYAARSEAIPPLPWQTFPPPFSACLHGGRLVWDGADSPHRAIARVRGALYFAFAEHDETCPEADQMAIEQALADRGGTGRAERFAAPHGWTFPTRWCHDRTAAELAHRRVLALFD